MDVTATETAISVSVEENGTVSVTIPNEQVVAVQAVGLGPQGPGGTLALHGAFIDTTDQPLASTATAQPLTLNTAIAYRGVTVANQSEITFSAPGTYTIVASLQVTNSSNNLAEVNFFFKKNNVDIPDSNTRIDLQQRKSTSVPYHGCFTIELQLELDAGDAVELYWIANTLGVSIDTIPANGTHPQAPSAIVNVAQVTFLQTTVPPGAVTGDTLSWDAQQQTWGPSDRLTLLEQRVAALENSL